MRRVAAGMVNKEEHHANGCLYAVERGGTGCGLAFGRDGWHVAIWQLTGFRLEAVVFPLTCVA